VTFHLFGLLYWWVGISASAGQCHNQTSRTFFGLHPSERVPSITLYSQADLPKTMAFTDRPGVPWVRYPMRTLYVTAYTDAPKLWTKVRYESAMKLARWYLMRCRIHMKIPKLRVLKRGTLLKKRHLRFRIPQRLIRTKRPDETFLFFTKYAYVTFPKRKRPTSLLGLSHYALVYDQNDRWRKRRAVWVRYSLIYTTTAHEIGHRLGLKHVRWPYNIMLTGSGVRSSARILSSSISGFFDVKRFQFTPGQCTKMHRVLIKEQKHSKK